MGTVLAQGTPSIDWWVMAGGGGSDSGTGVTLDGTLGQAVVGIDSGSSYELSAGFWGGVATEYKIFIPVVLKQN